MKKWLEKRAWKSKVPPSKEKTIRECDQGFLNMHIHNHVNKNRCSPPFLGGWTIQHIHMQTHTQKATQSHNCTHTHTNKTDNTLNTNKDTSTQSMIALHDLIMWQLSRKSWCSFARTTEWLYSCLGKVFSSLNNKCLPATNVHHLYDRKLVENW